MKPLSEATLLVRDNGLFLPIARRLAKDAKRVLYYTDCERAFSTINEAVPGDGFSDIERCNDIWEAKQDVDAFIFPDLGHSGEQKELVFQGYPVWGCRGGDEQELDRELFLKTLKRCGLEVAPHEVVEGLDNLREYLADKKDVYIKVSRYRGSFETSHFRSWDEDKGLLDLWGVKFGPVGDLIPFIVFPNIKTELEIGADTYNVRGQWPSLMIQGYEWKDRSYLGAVTKRKDMPQQIQDVLECYGSVLAKSDYASQFSMEVRVKDDKAYFIDPTCRGGLPSTASQLALWQNFSEIVYHGAHGELIDPIPTAKFSAESIVTLKGDKSIWSTFKMPPKLEDNLMVTSCCLVGDTIAFPPDEDSDGAIGWLVATGDTQLETIESQNALADELPDGLDANTECLAYVLKEIRQASEKGIEFSDEPTPEPAVVFQEEQK